MLLAAIAPAFAGAAVTPTGVTDKIAMKIDHGKLEFSGPKTITQGDELEIVNETNPKQIGPHTFSLVTKGSLPKTKPAVQQCFTPKHICLSIAKWQGAKGQEPPKINPSKAGAPGWSTPGSITKTGDSWFAGKKGASFTQIVSAAPTTLYYMCAIHPFMQGKVKVLPAPAIPTPTL